MEELRDALVKAHNPALARGKHGKVYLLWHTGEVKEFSSPLRNWYEGKKVNKQIPGFELDWLDMPSQYGRSEGYAFVTYEDAVKLRNMMIEEAKRRLDKLVMRV